MYKQQKNLIFSQAKLQAIKTKPTMAQMLGLEKENSRAAIINAFRELKEWTGDLCKQVKATKKEQMEILAVKVRTEMNNTWSGST